GSQPSSFHGAHVAGTVGANTNNDYGVAGVSWQTTLMHARVLGIGGGSSFDIANGLLWSAGLANATGLVANPPADIANMSLGGPGFSQTFQDACTAAWNAGTVVIAAAGNENSSTPSFPAAYDNVISVAAVDFERNKAPYSNFHPTVDIAAPGGDVSVDRNGDGYADGVLSNKPDDSVSPTNFENFSFYQGTSMAAPHVAGVAALILAVDPNLNPDQVDSILRNTATDLGAAGRDNIYGEGLVNAAAAVQLAAGGGGGPVLALDTDAVLLEGAGTRRVGVSNAGTGALDVTSVTTSPPSATWLSATAVATGQAGTTDTSAIDVTANASGLPSGNYAGTVLVDSNGGSRQIAVTLTVGASGPGTTFTVFVLAVDADTFDTRAQDVVQTSGSLAYGLGSLPPGRYVVVAGTDEDNDGLICDEGEPLCGLYPSINLATAIDLSDGQRVTGLDFPVQDTTGPAPASSDGQSGFRLLTRTPAADVAEGVRQ
ncbi:MAG: S8 family serine peptidase, partial [Planctomycetota bacterium]